MSVITRVEGIALRRTGHVEHDSHMIVGTFGRFAVSDTGNGGDTAYALMERGPDDVWRDIATGPTLQAVVQSYLNLRSTA